MDISLDKKIRMKMIEMDVSGAEIAREIGVHRSAINNTVKGILKSFRLRRAIADALQLKVTDIWPEKEKTL
jgi:DNA-binding XRE family transcriptional regulator